jgi:4-hydroxybenzoate polyprenyltransferase
MSNPDITPAAPVPRGGRSLALLQLVRIPTVFTAMGDIFLGFLLTHATLEPNATFAMLLGASVCLYWTGMILNDYFDRAVDAEERPGRPIPSGRVSAGMALKLALLLNAAGLGLAFLAGQNSLIIAVALTVAVWLYDGVLKKTPLAPLLMGSCRFFNLMLGASASPTGELWCPPQLVVAIGLGLYIVGLTWFARQEAKTSNRVQLVGAATVVNLGFSVLMAWLYHFGGEHRQTTLFVLTVILFTILRRLVRAITDPSPERVQTAIRVMLLSYLTIDATLVFYATGVAEYAVGVAALLIPAMLLSKKIPMT